MRILSSSILIVAAIVFVMLNVLSGVVFQTVRFDLTSNKIYTLSAPSKKMLKQIDEPVMLRFYFSKKISNFNPYLANYASRVRDMLRQYQLYSHGRVVLQIIDPEPFSTEEDNAIHYGLKGISRDNSGTDLYFGLVGSNSLDSWQVIPFMQPAREANLEYDISSLIYKSVNLQAIDASVVFDKIASKESFVRPFSYFRNLELTAQENFTQANSIEEKREILKTLNFKTEQVKFWMPVVTFGVVPLIIAMIGLCVWLVQIRRTSCSAVNP